MGPEFTSFLGIKIGGINDVLSLNNVRFSNYLHLIYPNELEVNDTTVTQKYATYLDLQIEIDNQGRLNIKL